MPYIVAPSRYVPVGVEPSPSRLWLDRPERPRFAVHGPATRRKQAPRRCHSESDAIVAPGCACTVTSCCAVDGPGQSRAPAAARAATLIARMVAVPATPPPFVARAERVTAADLPYSWHSGLSGRPLAAPPGAARLHRVRRQAASRRARRQRPRRPAGGRRVQDALPRALPDPPHAADRRVPRQRRPLRRGRQHVCVQLPRRGDVRSRSRGRCTPTAKRST